MSEESRITNVYDEYATRHNAAYTVFCQTYELETPRPLLAAVTRDIVSLIIILALTIVSIASIIVSGSRTIEEFGGRGIGTVAFVMIEGGIMAYGFFIARRNANKERLKNTVRWAMAGLVLTVIVGLGANADAVLRGHGIMLPNEITIIINLLVALSAPALAFISSDVLAIELMATDIRRRDASLEHEKKTRKWQKDMNTAWRAQQRNWGAKIQVEKQAPPMLMAHQISSNLIKNNQISSRNKPSPRLQKAIDYFNQHPEHLETPSRDLESVLGMSYGTINKAQVFVRNEQGRQL